ncbi:pilus assembly protein N-terminal domain-containing protein [Chelativorans sp. YIM 93263]|uniref:pilus assembly protein N-terminal domain-containing protein n=1 Tax=Chelativorans sp. YIM 93263 TaxID=2906648 RepID=UPI002379E0DB|nr:pilus assembly protein N-terminal domain-containing protein [Chelativorans sp. YIM 93263]
MRGTITFWRRTAAAALVAAGLLAISAAQAAEGINVIMNQAKVIKLARPADTVVIGNQEIADATVQDPSTLILTGRGFGVTNLLVLDEDGQPIVDEQIAVSRQQADSVRVYRRADVQTLSCTPYCEGAFRTPAEMLSDQQVSTP